jgi:hypothetical protein
MYFGNGVSSFPGALFAEVSITAFDDLLVF